MVCLKRERPMKIPDRTEPRITRKEKAKPGPNRELINPEWIQPHGSNFFHKNAKGRYKCHSLQRALARLDLRKKFLQFTSCRTLEAAAVTDQRALHTAQVISFSYYWFFL
jgi:hypothetical protein